MLFDADSRFDVLSSCTVSRQPMKLSKNPRDGRLKRRALKLG